MFNDSSTRPSNTSANSSVFNPCGWPSRNEISSHAIPVQTDLVLRPIWLIICTVGNLFNIILLRKYRTYQAFLLVALAYADLACMWLWMPHFAVNTAGAPDIWGGWLVHITVVLGNTAAQCSDWTLVIFCTTRLLSMLFPIRSRILFTRRRIRNTLLLLIPLCLLTWTFLIVSQIFSPDGNGTVYPWLEQWRIVDYYGIAVSEFVTFTAILLANIMIIFLLCMRRKRRTDQPESSPMYSLTPQHSLEQNTPNHRSRTRFVRTHGRDPHTTSTLRLLTASACLHVITKTPTIAYQSIDYLCAVYLPDDQFAILITIYNQLLFANYSVSFLVYCGVNRAYFRRGWLLMRHKGLFLLSAGSETSV